MLKIMYNTDRTPRVIVQTGFREKLGRKCKEMKVFYKYVNPSI